MKSINGLLLMVVELILLIAILAGVTPFVMTQLNNLSVTLVASGQSMGALLAPSSVGGILWFVLCIMIVIGVIILAIKGAKGGKGY